MINKKDIDEFLSEIQPCKRYTSYDYCFVYFQTHRGKLEDNIEISCLQLWSYLASWGMLRGSSQLLQCSAAALIPLIKVINKMDNKIWDMDIPDYKHDNNIKLLLETYNTIRECLQGKFNELGLKSDVRMHTLVTKIMLGVFGNIPAYDRYFTQTFHALYSKGTEYSFALNTFNSDSLKCIYDFYCKNQQTIDSYTHKALTFSGDDSGLFYKKAKIVDMYGFAHSHKK